MRLGKLVRGLLPESVPVTIGGVAGVLLHRTLTMNYCQTSPILCLSPDAATSIANIVSSLVLGTIVLFALVTILFYFVGTYSETVMRISGMFVERMLRVALGLPIIWLLVAYDLPSVITSQGGCAILNVDQLKTGAAGPLLLRLIFWAAALLGMV